MRHKKERALGEVNLAARDASASLARNAQGGNLEKVQKALTFGANVNVEQGWPIRWAAGNGHTEIVKLLIARGADVDAKGSDAIWWAATNGHLKTLEVLIKAGATMREHRFYSVQYLLENNATDLTLLKNRRLAAKMLVIAGMDFTELSEEHLRQLNLSREEYRQVARNQLAKL